MTRGGPDSASVPRMAPMTVLRGQGMGLGEAGLHAQELIGIA